MDNVFYATVYYWDLYSEDCTEHMEKFPDLGEAIGYIEGVFEKGYLTIRVDDVWYQFIPTVRIIGAEIKT